MTHEKGFGCFMAPKSRVGSACEKGFGCFLAPKSGVGRAWEGSK